MAFITAMRFGLLLLLGSAFIATVWSCAPEETASDIASHEAFCVSDPAADGASVILREHADEISARTDAPAKLADVVDCLSVESIGDLDGDAVDDLDVAEGCTWGVHAAAHRLYLSNHGCWTSAGEIIDGPLTPLQTMSNGVYDLESRRSQSCAGANLHWSHYQWDGTAYRVVDQATCELCEDDSEAEANQHPFCRAELDRRREVVD